MAQVEWIKILTFIFEDDKIRLIRDMPEGDTLLVLWFQLLTLAGKKNDYGRIYLTKGVPYTNEELAKVLERPVSVLDLALQVFKKFKMIGVDNLGITFIINWEKHQFIEGMQRIKEQTRLRVRRFREESKKKLEGKPDKKPVSKDGNVTKRYSNGIDKIRVDKIREEKKEKKDKKESVDSPAKKTKKEGKDPLEFSFKDKCWWGLYDWRIKMYQGAFPMLKVNYLFHDLWKTKFLEAPTKYKKIIKEQYEGKIDKLVWAWLNQEKKIYLKDHPIY